VEREGGIAGQRRSLYGGKMTANEYSLCKRRPNGGRWIGGNSEMAIRASGDSTACREAYRRELEAAIERLESSVQKLRHRRDLLVSEIYEWTGELDEALIKRWAQGVKPRHIAVAMQIPERFVVKRMRQLRADATPQMMIW
jgi:hypothetical protein